MARPTSRHFSPMAFQRFFSITEAAFRSNVLEIASEDEAAVGDWLSAFLLWTSECRRLWYDLLPLSPASARWR